MKKNILLINLLVLTVLFNFLNADVKTLVNPFSLGSVEDKNFTAEHNITWSGGLPLIEVVIDSKKYKFLFDTGAPTIIPKHLVEKLNLKSIEQNVIMHDAAGGESQKNIYTLPSMHIGDVEFVNFTVMTDDFSKIFPISCLGFDGIIGYNLLQNLYVKIDFHNSKIIFSDKSIKHKQ